MAQQRLPNLVRAYSVSAIQNEIESTDDNDNDPYSITALPGLHDAIENKRLLRLAIVVATDNVPLRSCSLRPSPVRLQLFRALRTPWINESQRQSRAVRVHFRKTCLTFDPPMRSRCAPIVSVSA